VNLLHESGAMNDYDEHGRDASHKEPVSQTGAFARRRNYPPVDHPEHDINGFKTEHPTSKDQESDDTRESALESIVERHNRLEWEASAQSYRTTKMLLSSLVRISPRGTLALVSNDTLILQLTFDTMRRPY
jgi:hypothetical protein